MLMMIKLVLWRGNDDVGDGDNAEDSHSDDCIGNDRHIQYGIDEIKFPVVQLLITKLSCNITYMYSIRVDLGYYTKVIFRQQHLKLRNIPTSI